ncbi:MAG: OadG family protein [Caldisericia bacterium]
MKIVTFWDTILFGILAMSVVFAVLALLGFIISQFKTFFYKEGKPPKEKIEKKEELQEKVLPEEKNKKKIAAMVAAINMYLSSRKGVTFAFLTPSKGEGVNLWKIKSTLGKRVTESKERRWKNG